MAGIEARFGLDEDDLERTVAQRELEGPIVCVTENPSPSPWSSAIAATTASCACPNPTWSNGSLTGVARPGAVPTPH